MAAEISEITESNHEYLCVSPDGAPSLADIEAELRIIHTETHATLEILREMREILEQFRPLLDRYATPAGAYMAARQARRRAIQANGQGQVQVPER